MAPLDVEELAGAPLSPPKAASSHFSPKQAPSGASLLCRSVSCNCLRSCSRSSPAPAPLSACGCSVTRPLAAGAGSPCANREAHGVLWKRSLEETADREPGRGECDVGPWRAPQTSLRPQTSGGGASEESRARRSTGRLVRKKSREKRRVGLKAHPDCVQSWRNLPLFGRACLTW